MPSRRLRPALLAALAAAAFAPAVPATLEAQSRDRWYEEERRDRERERRREEERRARERVERARHESQLRAHEQRMRLERERIERERRLRRDHQRWRDQYRPRLVLGGGVDLRRFGDDARYFAQGGVDFRGRSGFGVRPEVMFGWTDRQQDASGIFSCPNCLSIAPQGQVTVGRSRLLGVAVSGTYTAGMGRSPVRPYVLSGLGVFSTRAPEGVAVVFDPSRPGVPPTQVDVRRTFRTTTNIGLTAGAGLELDVGPVRLFGELRYLLVDQPRPLGFSGALPLTIGFKL